MDWVLSDLLDRKLIGAMKELIDAQKDLLDQVEQTRDKAFLHLTTLRSNCFIPNELGHKVRYWDASVERRAKAEGLD